MSDDPLKKLRKIILALPETSEKLSLRMRRTRAFEEKVTVLILLLLCGCQEKDADLAASAQPAEPMPGFQTTDVVYSPKGLIGRWQGELDFEGQPMEFAVAFRERDGSLGGKVDLFGRKGLSIESVVYQAPSLQFDFLSSAGTTVFSGEVTGGTIRGTFEMPRRQGSFSLSQVQPVDVDRIFASFMAAEHVPGVAAATVRDGEIVWVGTYGWANVAKSKPVTRQTLFMLASVSKTITATTLLQLHALDKFELDDDVNLYLPFEVRNPAHPDQPITFEQLLRHHSSLRDDPEFYGPLWSEPQGDPETVLGEYLASYLSTSGANYNAEKNFYQPPPGAEFNYCNTCYALLGYLAERISGQPFEEYSREVLFEPLGMTNARWFYAGVNKKQVALPYRHDSEAGFLPYGVVGYPDWPAGLLRTTVIELARFLAAYTQFGSLDGEQVFDASIVTTMTPASPSTGYYTWFLSSLESTTDLLYSHSGGDLGTRTMIGFNPTTREGFVILTNGESELSSLAAELYQAMPTLGWE